MKDEIINLKPVTDSEVEAIVEKIRLELKDKLDDLKVQYHFYLMYCTYVIWITAKVKGRLYYNEIRIPTLMLEHDIIDTDYWINKILESFRNAEKESEALE